MLLLTAISKVKHYSGSQAMTSERINNILVMVQDRDVVTIEQ